jgi:hypothetical protein
VRVHRPKQFQVLTSEFDQDPFHLKIDLDIQQSFRNNIQPLNQSFGISSTMRFDHPPAHDDLVASTHVLSTTWQRFCPPGAAPRKWLNVQIVHVGYVPTMHLLCYFGRSA